MIKPTPTPSFTQDVDRINPEKAFIKDEMSLLFEYCIKLVCLIAFIMFVVNVFGE